MTRTTLLFAPHADDETLFASHALLALQPMVVICYPSERDYGDTAVRTEESRRAAAIFGAGPVEQWHGGTVDELAAQMRALDEALRPARVWAPALPCSHPHHVAVAEAAAQVFGDRVVRYHTYVGLEKTRQGVRVPIEGRAAELKRQALACYETQRTHPRACVFYDESRFELDEYLEAADLALVDRVLAAVAFGADAHQTGGAEVGDTVEPPQPDAIETVVTGPDVVEVAAEATKKKGKKGKARG